MQNAECRMQIAAREAFLHFAFCILHSPPRCNMPRLTMRAIADMTHGEVIQGGDVETHSVVIDSREVKPDSAFFAIKGERLDGHQFVAQALQTALGAVVSQVPENVPAGKGLVLVGDTTLALQMLARAIRQR